MFTARKRSLRRLCFYTCLSFCSRGGGVYPSMQWANIIQTLSGADTPLGRHTPGQTHPWADTPWADTHLGRHPQADNLPGQTPPPTGRYPCPLCRHPPRQTPPGRHPPGQTPLLGRLPFWAVPLSRQTPHFWEDPPGQTPPQADTPPPNACCDMVNKRAVRIQIEYILAKVKIRTINELRNLQCTQGFPICTYNTYSP